MIDKDKNPKDAQAVKMRATFATEKEEIWEAVRAYMKACGGHDAHNEEQDRAREAFSVELDDLVVKVAIIGALKATNELFSGP